MEVGKLRKYGEWRTFLDPQSKILFSELDNLEQYIRTSLKKKKEKEKQVSIVIGEDKPCTDQVYIK